MFQWIGFLLCLLLVFVGLQPLVTALSSAKENKRGVVALAAFAFLVGVLIAAYFAYLFAHYPPGQLP